MNGEIKSLEEYRALEGEMKGLMAGLGSMGDLVDQGSTTDAAQMVIQKVGAIKDKLSAYRDAHPEEFTQ